MRHRSSSSAFSLLEVTIYSFLLLLLLGGLFVVVRGGLRYYRLEHAHQDAYREAGLALRRIARDVTNGCQGAVSFGSAPVSHLLFLSASAPSTVLDRRWTYSGARLQYKKWVSYYHESESRVVRAELPLASPTVDPGSSPPPDFVAEVLSRPFKILVRRVKTLEYQTVLSDTLRIRMVTSVPTGTDRETSVELQTSVRIRNL